MLTLNITIEKNYLKNIQKVLVNKLKLTNASYDNIISTISQYDELSVECMQITQLLIEHCSMYGNEKLARKIILLAKHNKNAHFLLFEDSKKNVFDNYIILREIIKDVLDGSSDKHEYIINNLDIVKYKLVNIIKIINDYADTKFKLFNAEKLLTDIFNKLDSKTILNDIAESNVCGINFRNVISYRKEVDEILQRIKNYGK